MKTHNYSSGRASRVHVLVCFVSRRYICDAQISGARRLYHYCFYVLGQHTLRLASGVSRTERTFVNQRLSCVY